MARANRHYLPGHIRHITHRCHKREFLLRFSKDHHRWLQWLFEARRRFKLLILNLYGHLQSHYLLVLGGEDRDVIPRSMQLVAGQTAQEYNQWKKRKGAFWEDRYHATAIESGNHLCQCLVYIDLNMVRAGVVRHPSEWPFGGYNEIRKPRRKCTLIACDHLQHLFGSATYEQMRDAHRHWVEEALRSGISVREGKWSASIGVGVKEFVNRVKSESGARGRWKRIEGESGEFELRESGTAHHPHFEAENEEIDQENTLPWDHYLEISNG